MSQISAKLTCNQDVKIFVCLAHFNGRPDQYTLGWRNSKWTGILGCRRILSFLAYIYGGESLDNVKKECLFEPSEMLRSSVIDCPSFFVPSSYLSQKFVFRVLIWFCLPLFLLRICPLSIWTRLYWSLWRWLSLLKRSLGQLFRSDSKIHLLVCPQNWAKPWIGKRKFTWGGCKFHFQRSQCKS